MSDPFIAEVRPVGFNFAPRGWFPCDGRLLPIASYQALFAILGTTYGGDGVGSFALPDLRGRVPAHPGTSLVTAPGQKGGAENVTLTVNQMPSHAHTFSGSLQQGASTAPIGNVLAAKARRGVDLFASPPPNVSINSQDAVGNSVPHDNLQPYLVVNYIIAYLGIFPVRN
jgi:microcystin-dependent protein